MQPYDLRSKHVAFSVHSVGGLAGKASINAFERDLRYVMHLDGEAPMAEASRDDQIQMGELLRLAAATDQVEMVLADAKRGIDDPESLTTVEVQRVCFALVAAYAMRSKRS